jgi:PKHD-type hydroxylase
MKYDYFFMSKLYSHEECIALEQKIKNNINPNIPDLKADDVLKTANVGSFMLGSLKSDLKKFLDNIVAINRSNFGFDVFETCDLEYINYNQYIDLDNGQYSWHSDKVLHQPYDIKLTAILNISTEPYEGGDFEIFLNGPTKVSELDDPGSLLVFPSFLQHRVTPVTKGKRTTISRWVNGPTLK